jgi:hypothetical protein
MTEFITDRRSFLTERYELIVVVSSPSVTKKMSIRYSGAGTVGFGLRFRPDTDTGIGTQPEFAC